MLPREEHFVAQRVWNAIAEFRVVEEVVVAPIVQRAAAVRARAADELHEHRPARADEVNLLHRLRERIAESFDDSRRIWIVSVVNCQ